MGAVVRWQNRHGVTNGSPHCRVRANFRPHPAPLRHLRGAETRGICIGRKLRLHHFRCHDLCHGGIRQSVFLSSRLERTQTVTRRKKRRAKGTHPSERTRYSKLRQDEVRVVETNEQGENGGTSRRDETHENGGGDDDDDDDSSKSTTESVANRDERRLNI